MDIEIYIDVAGMGVYGWTCLLYLKIHRFLGWGRERETSADYFSFPSCRLKAKVPMGEKRRSTCLSKSVFLVSFSSWRIDG